MGAKVYADILFAPDMSRLAKTLQDSLMEGLSQGSFDYRPDPFKREFRASQAPYCSRKLVFKNILDWDESPTLIDKANGGTLIHHIKQSLLAKSSLNVINEEEMKVKEREIKVSGHMDIIVLDFGECLVCIDIKTTDSFSYLDHKGEPNQHHKDQLNQYLHYLKDKYPNKIILGVLWYILRILMGEQVLYYLYPKNWRLFFVEYNPERWIHIVEKLLNIVNCLENGILPSFDHEKWECANKTAVCPYLDLCFGENAKITTVKEMLVATGEENNE